MPLAAHNPTLIVSWSHTEPGWSPDQALQRQNAVLRLTNNLRSLGVDADLDLNQPGGSADWTRWGPAKIRSSDFVLIVGSPAWNSAWQGDGDMTRGAGAAAEADALKSLYNEDRAAFLRKVRMVFLPGTPTDVPWGLDGIERYRLEDNTPESLSLLIRDLSNQPAFPKQPLGKLPSLPPDDSWRDGSSHAPDAAPSSTPASHVGATGGTELRYEPLGQPVQVRWRAEWATRESFQEMAITVHVVPYGSPPIPARRLDALSVPLPRQLRATGLFRESDALTTTDDAEGILVTTPREQGFMREVRPGRLLGARVDRSGQVSAWHSLSADGLGSVLDEPSATAVIQDCLRAIAATGVVPDADLAMAVEISPVTMLSLGNVSTLGHRNSATSHFAFGPEVRKVEPDELVEFRALGSGAEEVAGTLARLLLRSMTQS